MLTRTAPTRCCEKVAKAGSRSLSVLAFTTTSCRPSVRAAACRSAMMDWVAGKAGSARTPNRAALGINSRSNCNCFGASSASKMVDAGDVRAGPVEAGDKTQCDRVTAGAKDDRYGRGRCLRRQRCGGAGGYDHRYAAADEIGCKRRQPIVLILRPAVLDRHVLALDIAGFLQALEKWNGVVLVVIVSGLGAEDTRSPASPRCCARATSGHAAALPSPAMNSRRFV